MTTDSSPFKYGIMLSKEQLDFLVDDRQGFHRMKAFDTFVRMASTKSQQYRKPGFAVSLSVGQFAISTVELASLWQCDRKTASKVVQMFNRMGILSSVPNNRTSVHTLLCVAAWYIDGVKEPIRNPFYERQNPKSPNAEVEVVSDGASNTPSTSGGCASPSSNDSAVGSQLSSTLGKDSNSREEKSPTAVDEDGLPSSEFPPDEPDFPPDVVFDDMGNLLTASSAVDVSKPISNKGQIA